MKHLLKPKENVGEKLEAEREEGEVKAESESEYNPLKLPMEWDGKPIPYWLYKLHLLSQEFNCEICGGYRYRGRQAYERHFEEWRHEHGMRCLGIPNTKNFNEITSIEVVLKICIVLFYLKNKIGKEKNKTDYLTSISVLEGRKGS